MNKEQDKKYKGEATPTEDQIYLFFKSKTCSALTIGFQATFFL